METIVSWRWGGCQCCGKIRGSARLALRYHGGSQVGAINMLIKAGADINRLDGHGLAPLLREAEEN